LATPFVSAFIERLQIYQGKNDTRKLSIDIQSLVEHLPVTRQKIVMKQQEDQSLLLISAPSQYRQMIAEISNPKISTSEIPSVTVAAQSQTSESIESQDSKVYQPSRLELVNWYKILKANNLDIKLILELGHQLKNSYMQEDFMKGKPSVEKLPDDYRSASVLISLEDKKYFDSINQPLIQKQSDRSVGNDSSYSRS
jgi:hypothetical protein